jgi:hypothetical protein
MALRKAVLLGIANWAIAFAAALALSPIKDSRRLLFESLMPVVLAASTTGLGLFYFRNRGAATAGEGLRIGLLWAIISVLIDLPLMLPPPISMPPADYVADIGVVYLIMPIITTGLAAARNRQTDAPPDHDSGV